ncbi:MAG: nitrogenase [Clostridiales bacterium]|jgi:nitrogenase molybdenum-iron protein alpha chain|nr:nitrogenase [Clostridiales bacterium]
MAENIKNSLKKVSVSTREQRLGSVTGYHGDLQDLVSKSRCGTLKNRERCFSQSSLCLSNCAIGQLLGIRDVAVIYHAPSGCCATAAGINVLLRQLAVRIGTVNDTIMVGSDIDEKDAVFGALGYVRDIVKKVDERYKPKAIFVASSCVAGVIGEDIDSLTDELTEELAKPVIPLHCEGFKSRIWASGFDVSDHAIVKRIVKPPKEKRPVINFKNFFESERKQITEIFGELGVKPQFLYLNSTVEELEHLSESLATVCICGTLGTYLGNALEEMYGVPYIRTINPMGIRGFEAWLREIGKVIGKEKEADAFLRREREKYLPEINELKKELKGLKAVIGMGPGYTYEVARVLQELDMEVVWAAAWHYDGRYDNDAVPPALDFLQKNSPNNIGLSVADQQNYEVMNILNRFKPDLYFSRHPGTTVWAIKQGISAVFVADEYMIFGYKGTLSFAKTILDTVRNRSFEKNLAARVKLPYTDWWYKQDDKSMML